MTNPQIPAPPAGAPMIQPPPPVQIPVVLATPDSRLEQLLALYAQYKPLVDEYTEKLKAVTDGIKVELTLAAPGHTKIKVDSPELTRPLQLMAVEQTRIDTKALHAEAPEVYAFFARKQTVWQLRRAS